MRELTILIARSAIIKLTQTVNRSNQSDWVSSLVKVRSNVGESRTCMPANFL